MSSSDTIHLLICSESQQDAEHYSNLIRAAGQTARVHRVTSSQDLRDSIGDSNWEILIATDAHPEISPDQAISLVLEADQQDLPVLVSLGGAEQDQVEALLGAGACDVIQRSDETRLAHAVKREVDAVRYRRQYKELEVAYEETARRCELLLKTAQDAIAYITDGMHIHANEVYAQLFAYEDVDELAGIPQIDLIAPDNQKDFKDALRRYRDNPDEETRIEFTGIRGDGGEFPASMILSTASYEGESCMQVLVRADGGGGTAATGAATAGSGSAGFDTVKQLVGAALGSTGTRHLALLMVDDFAEHTRNLGLSRADSLVAELDGWLEGAGDWQLPPMRIGADLFAGIMAEANTEKCTAQAAELAKKLAANVQEVNQQSVALNCCVAVGKLDRESGLDADTIIDETWTALCAIGPALEAGGESRSRVRAAVLETAASSTEINAAAASALQAALNDNAFQLMFQPIVSLRGDSSEHYEVSICHTADGESKPVETWMTENGIEDAGSSLDQWEVQESLKALASHRGAQSRTCLIINIDTASILDSEFPGWLSKQFKAQELEASSVTFQLSIDAASTYLKNTKEFADRLRGMGCHLSVSGIGCNENHLGMLERLSPSFAKLDEEVSAMLDKPDKVSDLLKPMLENLHQQQMASIMPGVTSAGSLAVLWQLGIHFIQGEYLHRPAATMDYEFSDLT